MDNEQREIEGLVNAYVNACRKRLLDCLSAFKDLEDCSSDLQEKYASPEDTLTENKKAS